MLTEQIAFGLLGLFALAATWCWMRSRARAEAWKFERLLKAERQNAQTHADRLQAFLSAIQASPNGLVVLDPEQRIEWCNRTAAQLLGLDAKRDVAQHIVHLVRDPQFLEYMTNHDFDHEIQFDNKALQLHPYGEGRALLLVRDIADTLRADLMRRDFVANVSHEIRTPLTVIAGFIETLQTLDVSEQERQHYLQLMAAQSQRMQAIVNDLLTLSKLDEQAKPRLERVDVPALLTLCEQEAHALANSLKRTLNIHFEFESVSDVIGSASELQSAFSNLITNAVRYTPDGGRVTVTWQRDVLTVQDTGRGIAPEHIPRLTERFYRVDAGRSRGAGETSGTGLGLAIVKHVAQRHGAQLEIESTLGVGSVFRLVFDAH